MGEKDRAYDAIEISGTTDAGGDAVVDSGQKNIMGEVVAVIVDGHNLTDGADLDINSVYTDVDGDDLLGIDILDNEDVGNATLNELYPYDFVEDIAGADVEAPATYKFVRRFALAGCALRVTVANGGNTKTFKVWVLVAL